MKFLRTAVAAPSLVTKPALAKTRKRVIAMLAITSLVSTGVIAMDGCDNQSFNIGPTKGQVVGAILGSAAILGGTTAVLIAVHKSHHSVKGCVISSENGLLIENGDKKTYLLAGNTATIKPNILLKLHGTKSKRLKGAVGNPTFEVEKISHNYGPCTVSPNVSPNTADPKKSFRD